MHTYQQQMHPTLIVRVFLKGILLCEMFKFCRVLLTVKASETALDPLCVIIFPDKSSSISVVLVLRHSLKGITPSLDISLCDIFNFCSVLLTIKASAIALDPLCVIIIIS